MNDKVKKRRIRLFLLFLSCIVFFSLGNRLGYIYQQYSLNGDSFFIASAHSFENLLSSYKLDNIGFLPSFSSVPILIGALFVFVVVLIYLINTSKRTNFKVGSEHGSAEFGDVYTTKKLKDPEGKKNMIFSQNIQMTMDTRKTFLNNNVMIIGGSGSGKTRYVVKPNILEMNCNYVLTDPKGGVITSCGKALIDNHYDIKILDLINMSDSMHYNPFAYCNTPNDVMKLLNNLMDNTSDPNRKGGDEFWDKAGLALLMALSYLMMGFSPADERNFPTLMGLIDLTDASEEDENSQSIMDVVFEDLNEEVAVRMASGNSQIVSACKNSYEYLATRQYTLYKKGTGKTAKSILITLGARLAVFNLPEVEELFSNDELNLRTIAEPKIKVGYDPNSLADDKFIKTALFLIIPDSDKTFNFIAAILYQQLFDLLYNVADSCPGERLPIHTRVILDEFANVGKIPSFESKIATMRSREISAMVILQNLSQLKGLYKDEVWETIYGNCDTTIFLGGKEYSTLEYQSKNMGNTTIDYTSVSTSKGSNSSYSTSNQLIQRPLMEPAEIGRLGKDECLIHIRTEFFFKDKKYDLSRHPNIHLTTDASNKEVARNNMYDRMHEITYKRDHGLTEQEFKQNEKNKITYSSSADFPFELMEDFCDRK